MSGQALPIPLMAHRGYAEAYPENTLAAISAAGDAGIDLIEFDIQLSRDGVPVLMHDNSLKRTANSKLLVTETDSTDLALIEANYADGFGSVHSGNVIPTLEAALTLLEKNCDWTYFIELKRESIDVFGAEYVVEKLLPLIYDYLPRCVLISFEYECLEEVCRRSDVHVGWVLREYSEQSHGQALALDPDYLLINHRRLPRRDVALWEGDWQWVSYEVTDAPHARELRDRGIDIISSMAAPQLAAELSQ